MLSIAEIMIYTISIIGGATLIFRGLDKLAAMTKTKKDDKFTKAVLKILDMLMKFTQHLSLNKSSNRIAVKVKK